MAGCFSAVTPDDPAAGRAPQGRWAYPPLGSGKGRVGTTSNIAS